MSFRTSAGLAVVLLAAFIVIAGCDPTKAVTPVTERATTAAVPSLIGAASTAAGASTVATQESPAGASTTSSATAAASTAATAPSATAVQPAPTSPAIATGAGPQATYRVEAQPVAGSCHYTFLDAASGQVLPDAKCTPGAISPAVTQTNLASTICKSGYTKSVRPPESVTDREKAANAQSYGYTGSFKVGEYDHLIPLELGGDPNDPRNLWVEPNDADATNVNNPKDSVESSLNYLVCNAVHGKPYLPLATAQQLIATNWTTAKAEAQHFLRTH